MTKLSDEELERLRGIAQTDAPDEVTGKRRAGAMAPLGSTAKARAAAAAHNAEHVAYLHGSGHWSGQSRRLAGTHHT